jgi:hypothetical protein
VIAGNVKEGILEEKDVTQLPVFQEMGTISLL